MGDANLDGKVDAADLNILALNWRTPVAGWGSADFTKDEMVNAADLNALALHWRQDVSASPAAAGPVGFIRRVPRAPLQRRPHEMDMDTLGERQITIYHPSPIPHPRYSAARAVESPTYWLIRIK